MPSIKQVVTCRKAKGVRAFCSYSFSHALPARYSVLHLLGVLPSDNEPPLCKGRWLAKQDGGIVTKQKFIVKQSLSRLRRQLPLHKGAFLLFIYALSIFLINTAFIDTKTKPRARRGKKSQHDLSKFFRIMNLIPHQRCRHFYIGNAVRFRE